MNRHSFVAAAVIFAACLTLPASAAFAQGPARQFAPGVLTTIPPAPQAEEMFSGPVPLVEVPISIDGLEYDPKLAPKTDTIFERSKMATLRRTIWNLEFSFKPMRMIYVDVPQPEGRMQRKLVWYLVYRVRNLGGHMLPEEVVEKVTAAGEEGGETLRTNITYKPGTTDEVEMFGQKTTQLRFFPHFVLRSIEYDKEYLDRVIPAALAPIKAREFPGRESVKLHDSISISQTPIPISTDTEDHSVWGVATWTDIDLRIDYFVVNVQGLTNAYRFEDPAGAFKKGDAPGTGRKIVRKTLQLNFWRPGDTVDPTEEEIHYGCPIDPDLAAQQEIFKKYGIDRAIDHHWVYR